MNIRLITAGAALLVLTVSGGCSGMRNFLFGRGAACGAACGVGAASGPRFGLHRQERGCGFEPVCGHEPVCGYEPGCGYEPVCGHEPVCGFEAPVTRRPLHRPFAGLRGCGLLGGRGTCGGSPSCNCGAAPGRSFMPPPYDPYAGAYPYEHSGNVIGSQVIDPYSYPGVVYPGDEFMPRGERIIGAETLPGSPITQ